MIKTAAFVIIIALRLTYQPSQEQRQHIAPFTSHPQTSISASEITASSIGIGGIKINNELLLKLIISQNQPAWCFEKRESAGANFCHPM